MISSFSQALLAGIVEHFVNLRLPKRFLLTWQAQREWMHSSTDRASFLPRDSCIKQPNGSVAALSGAAKGERRTSLGDHLSWSLQPSAGMAVSSIGVWTPIGCVGGKRGHLVLMKEPDDAVTKGDILIAIRCITLI